MDWVPILVMILGLLLCLFIIVFLIKRRLAFLIPSIILLMISILLIGLSQISDTSGDGWNDVIYMIFGVLFLISSVVVTSIVLSIKAYKKNKE